MRYGVELVNNPDGTVTITDGTYERALPLLLDMAKERSEAAGHPVIVVLKSPPWKQGPEIHVGSDTPLMPLKRDLFRQRVGYLSDDAVIGPDPSPVLTAEEKASDAVIQAALDASRALRVDEHKAKKLARAIESRRILATAPPMERDEAAWQCWWDSRQGEGNDTHRRMLFAERWARRMQVELAAGRSLTPSERTKPDWQSFGYWVEFEDNFEDDFDSLREILWDCWPPAKQLWQKAD